MKYFTIFNFFQAVLSCTLLNFGTVSFAQTSMTATAKDGTVLSFSFPKERGDSTELLIRSSTNKVKKYLVDMPLIDGQIQFTGTVFCQRNCANAKPATPGMPLKGSYQKINNQLRCAKNCSGLENGLIFSGKI